MPRRRAPLERRHSIAEVSEMVGVSMTVLRQWEERFPQLRPRRDRANRRYYLADDIAVVRRIKQLLRHERLTTAGARVRLDEELMGAGRPETLQEARELLAAAEEKVRAMIDRLERSGEL